MYKTEDNQERFFSSILSLNEENRDYLFTRAPLIKYEYFDDNNDDIIDRFKYIITFETDDVRNLQNIKLIIGFKYEFRINVVGRMHTIAVVDIDTPFGASYIQVDGDLTLKQKSPIDRTTFYNEHYYGTILPNTTDFNEIVNEYYSRNFTTYYDYDTYIVPMKNPKIVRIEVNINIPSFQKILYSTPLFTKIKFFWVQYAAVLIPVAGIAYFIMQFAFRNHIISSINSNDIDIKKKKIL